MLKIAITGNIASGKSAVQNILENRGYKVLDTDQIGHKLLDTMPAIKDAFKDVDVFENGVISRDKLGRLIFSNPEHKKTLEEIIHPAIKEEILKFFCQNKNETLVFVGIPLLFESDMRDIFDKALLIYTDDEVRLQRLLSRNHYSLGYAKQRLQSQMPQDDKINLCDFVIYNNGTISELETSVKDFLSEF